jgi:geranylgeranyl reductase family protein
LQPKLLRWKAPRVSSYNDHQMRGCRAALSARAVREPDGPLTMTPPARTDYDVIIVGAGPAGASAAYAAAQQGLDVLLLEKERLPRYKPCGGGLPLKVAQALAFDLAPTVEQAIHGAQITSGWGQAVNYHFGRPLGWCVMRSAFDQFLAERAVESGATLLTGCAVRRVSEQPDRVRVETHAAAYTARALVGADGVNGVVGRAVGLNAGRQYGAALEAEITVGAAAQAAAAGRLRLHFGDVPWGYAWVFPKARHLSVGVATFQTRTALNLRALLRRFLAQQPELREHSVTLLRGHRLPLGGQALPLHHGRVLLAGDAGGFADPFLGEGIYYAIRSGQMAGQCVARALAGGQPDFAGYTLQANAQFHAEFRHMRRFAAVFYGLPALCLRLHARSQTLQALCQQMLLSGFSFQLTPRKVARVTSRLARDLVRPYTNRSSA